MSSIYELAQRINRQKQGTGGGNQYFDNAMQVMQILDQKSKEKTARTVGGMETMMGDFSKVYDNNQLKDRMEMFEKRFGGKNKNKMGVDELEAYENAKLMMSRQMEKNSNFNMYQDKLSSVTKQMNDWMKSADGTKQPDAESIKSIMTDYMDVRRNFASTHADRLSSRSFDYLNKDMDSIHEMGSFAIQSLADDGILSQGEAKAFGMSLTTLDPMHIQEFTKNRDAIALEGHKENVSQMNELMKDYSGYEDLLGRIDTDEEGEYYLDNKGNRIDTSTESLENAMDEIDMKLQNLDNAYMQSKFNVEKESYLKGSGFDVSVELPGGGGTGSGTSDTGGEEIGESVEIDSLQPKAEVDEPKTKVQRITDFSIEKFNEAEEATEGSLAKTLGLVAGAGGAYVGAKNATKAKDALTQAYRSSAEFLNINSNFSKDQVKEFLSSDQVKNTTKKIDDIDGKIKRITSKLSQTSKKNKPKLEAQIDTLKKQRDRITSGRSKYWAKKFNVPESKINSLWNAKNLKKWNAFGFEKVLSKMGGGKLGAAIGLGRKGVVGDLLSDALGFDFGVIGDVATGTITEKTARSIGSNLMKMVKSPGGRKILAKVAGKQALKKVATGAAMGGGYLSLVTGLVGAGVAIKDVYDAINEWNESEFKEEEK
jgi:hypothetical protein